MRSQNIANGLAESLEERLKVEERFFGGVRDVVQQRHKGREAAIQLWFEELRLMTHKFDIYPLGLSTHHFVPGVSLVGFPG